MDNPLTPQDEAQLREVVARMMSENPDKGVIDVVWVADLLAGLDAARAPSASEDVGLLRDLWTWMVDAGPFIEGVMVVAKGHGGSMDPGLALLARVPELRSRVEAALGSASEDVGLREALDSDDFRDAHERAMRDHLLARPGGWPHLRTGSMPGDGPQSVDGCDDIVDRLSAALRAASPTPETPQEDER